MANVSLLSLFLFLLPPAVVMTLYSHCMKALVSDLCFVSFSTTVAEP